LDSILIRGGTVADGSGSPPAELNVGIKGSRISGLYKPSETPKASMVIDATGMMVSPGFVDIHTHSDLYLLQNPLAESKIRQGVTTELVGNCGSSAAPLIGAARDGLAESARDLEVKIDWSSVDEYLLRLCNLRTSVNVATLVGAETLRLCVLGTKDIKADPESLKKMNGLLAESMLQGAFGLSSGLIYAPGCYASTEELISLASTSASLGGIYTSHIRGEGGTLVRAVEEAIRIGREAHTFVEISHHKACGRPNWGTVNETLKMIERARAEGIGVGFDVYPYTASNTSLDSILPPWARDGGKEATLNRIRDPDERRRIAETFSTRSEEFENTVLEDGWENIVVVGLTHGSNRKFENKSVADIAKELGKDPAETAFDLMVEENLNVSAIFHEISEDDVMTVMRHPLACIGSDGMAESTYGPLSKSATHPRSYGTFPRVLRRYSIEKGLFPLHEAIMKMTSIPAKRIGLPDRGMLAKGMIADIVVFDPLNVRDLSTFEDSHRYPEGIVHVLVNGAVTIENGHHTKERAGLVLRHTPGVS
jgi:N-acyl-D-amino-acid deacylase